MRYKQYFEVDRYFNRLLREQDQREVAVNYRSTGNERERNSLTKKEFLKYIGGNNGYNSVN
jgi:DNA primase catalytic subunit